jgi:hypothetical protein
MTDFELLNMFKSGPVTVHYYANRGGLQITLLEEHPDFDAFIDGLKAARYVMYNDSRYDFDKTIVKAITLIQERRTKA